MLKPIKFNYYIAINSLQTGIIKQDTFHTILNRSYTTHIHSTLIKYKFR